MNAPFVASLRTRTDPIRVGSGGMSIRVQMPDVWDAVKIDAGAETTVEEVKRAALAELWPEAEYDADFIMKLRGFEMLDEQQPLREAGATNGSIFLLTHRRRRPVR